jgi:hypothetical protein
MRPKGLIFFCYFKEDEEKEEGQMTKNVLECLGKDACAKACLIYATNLAEFLKTCFPDDAWMEMLQKHLEATEIYVEDNLLGR